VCVCLCTCAQSQAGAIAGISAGSQGRPRAGCRSGCTDAPPAQAAWAHSGGREGLTPPMQSTCPGSRIAPAHSAGIATRSPANKSRACVRKPHAQRSRSEMVAWRTQHLIVCDGVGLYPLTASLVQLVPAVARPGSQPEPAAAVASHEHWQKHKKLVGGSGMVHHIGRCGCGSSFVLMSDCKAPNH